MQTTKTTSRRTQRQQSQRQNKRQYRLRNWKEYNRALRQRGNLNFWVDTETIKRWLHPQKTGKRGASAYYTDTAILCCLTLQVLFRLPLRATEGLVTSIFAMMGVDLPVPHYTILCRRRKTIEVRLPRFHRGEPMHVVVDSTGLKVYGEGEWKVRQHGWCKRRTWRKMHLAVDEATQEIVAVVFSTNGVADCQALPHLLKQIPEEITQLSGDGGYDTRECYEQAEARGARATIPPRKNAHIWQHGNSSEPPLPRDENLRRIREVGRKQWKEESGYHRRSLAETAMYRQKTILGGELSAREIEGQQRELFIRCAILNRMTALGMPDSYAA
jgi:hypothetical protein